MRQLRHLTSQAIAHAITADTRTRARVERDVAEPPMRLIMAAMALGMLVSVFI